MDFRSEGTRRSVKFSTFLLRSLKVERCDFTGKNRSGAGALSKLGFLLCPSNRPGIVNRTFENRTQSNSIELNRGLSSIEFEFGNRTKSNTTLSVSSISEQIELNRTQLNGFRSIGSGEPILALVNRQSKPKASPSKQVFLALFLLFIQ